MIKSLTVSISDDHDLLFQSVGYWYGVTLLLNLDETDLVSKDPG
jgi:hypothetical protein